MVIDRGKVKREAKEVLRGQVFSVFLVLFVPWLILNILGLISSGFSLFRTVPQYVEILRNFDDSYLPALGPSDFPGKGDMLSFAVGSLLSQANAVISLFLLPLAVSIVHYMMRVARKEKLQPGASIGMVFREGFQKYGAYFGTVFLTNLLIVLWTWLLIVPGIIKSLEYKFTFYVKADNPRLSSEQCRNLSSRITYGHKLDLFILSLSFIGWGLLNLLTFGLVSIYYAPYRETTYALLYDELKKDALNTGKIAPQELDPAVYPQPPMGYAYNARPIYGAYPMAPPQARPGARTTPQMLKQAVVNAYPGLPVLKSGVPALHWQHALSLIEECRKNGFFILDVAAYFPSGRFAAGHSLRAPQGNTWEFSRQFILQKAQMYELYYEIVF